MKKVIFLACCFILISCATQKKAIEKLNSRLGMQESELIDILGTPKSFYELGDKRYLTYDYSSSRYIPTTTSTYNNSGQVTTYTNGGYVSNYVCIVTYIIQNNRVVDWRYKGRCTSY